MGFDVRVDRGLDFLRDVVGVIEIPCEIVGECERGVADIAQPPVQLHPFARELTQIDVGRPRARSRSGGPGANRLFERMIVHRKIVVAELVEPLDDILAWRNGRTCSTSTSTPKDHNIRRHNQPLNGHYRQNGDPVSPIPVPANTEQALIAVIVQLAVIIAAARIAGNIFRLLDQPLVCGEIAAGLILGPSLFGKLSPSAFHAVFNPSAAQSLGILSQLGVILLMFLIGLEFDFGHLRENQRTALAVSIAGIALPFALGVALGAFVHTRLALGGSWVNFALFMGTAMSITAIPVLARIMIDLNINRTRLGSCTMAAAAINDAAGWIILALVIAIVRSDFNPFRVVIMVASVLVYALIMVFVVRPAFIGWLSSVFAANGGLFSLNVLATILIVVLLSAAATSTIGIHSIFGGFMAGAVFSDQPEFRAAVKQRLDDLVSAFFLPLFFTYTGLRTDIGAMSGSFLWGLCALVVITAALGKFGGCTVAARLTGLAWREASIVGVMMNARGLVELIVINIGYDLGILPKPVFFMLVFMAVATTYMTAPVLRWLLPRSEAAEAYRASVLAVRRTTLR
jgi:Kef-type K+ transport system membrane component KefB